MGEVVKKLKESVARLDGFAGYTGKTEGEEGYSGIENLVKYKEPKWYLNGVELPADEEYIVKRVGRNVIKWHPDKSLAPDRYPVPDGEKFPDLKERNKQTPQTEWVEAPGGQLKGPWAPEHEVVLLNRTYDELTYVTSTAGGSIAVKQLVKKVNDVRDYHNDNSLHLVVKLSNTFMPTRYDGLQRPHFVFLRAVKYGAGGATTVQLPNRVAESLDKFAANDDAQTVEKPSAKDIGKDIGDEIIF
jgi:hypothetical protein